MPRHCSVCIKTDKKSISRSHSHIPTIRRQKVNLQSKKIDGKRVLVCARCIRTKNTKAEMQMA